MLPKVSSTVINEMFRPTHRFKLNTLYYYDFILSILCINFDNFTKYGKIKLDEGMTLEHF